MRSRLPSKGPRSWGAARVSTDDNLRIPPVSVKAVLFDLDDTILDSYQARVQALQTVFEEALLGLSASQFLEDLQGAPFEAALIRLAVDYNINRNLFDSYRRAYWNRPERNLRLFPGVRLMLNTLQNHGYKLGIVTSKFRDTGFEGKRIGCWYELKELDITSFFPAVIGLEDVNQPKPDPEGILIALECLGSSQQETVVVGDSSADMQAARSAGCRNCLATWGIKNSSETVAMVADSVAGSPDDVVRLIHDLS